MTKAAREYWVVFDRTFRGVASVQARSAKEAKGKFFAGEYVEQDEQDAVRVVIRSVAKAGSGD